MNIINITHLVISGGGMQGVIYAGALRYLYLENLHKNITHIAGTSVGAFVGVLIALKLSIEEIEEIINSILTNPKCNLIPKKYFLKIISDYGLLATKDIVDTLRNITKSKYDIDDITFKELSQKFGVNMYISTTNINSCKNKIFSVEDTPDMSVFKVCEASMSVPILYKPVLIDNNYYYDGGLSNNFPAKLFINVPKENILGMVLYKDISDDYNALPIENMNLITILKQLFYIFNMLRVKEALFRQITEENRDYYLIFDNIPFKYFMNFSTTKDGLKADISIDQINEMIYAGFDSMSKYIQKRTEMMEKNNKERLKDIII